MSGILAALNLLLQLSVAQQELATLLQTAQSEGRDISKAELDTIDLKLKISFDNLDNAIEEASQ